MNIVLSITIILLTPVLVQAQDADSTRREVVLLNNKEIVAAKLLLINPKKIIGIRVSSPATGVKQYQIETKKIDFINYEGLKARLHIKVDQNPDVYVEGRNMSNKTDLEIDESFIKKVEYSNGAIRVLTKAKHLKLMTPCRGHDYQDIFELA